MNTEHVTLQLPINLYEKLQALAEAKHTDPVGVIEKLLVAEYASQLSLATSEEQPLSDLISDLIGAIDSQTDPHPPHEKTLFGEGIATKLAQQGLQRP